MSQKRLKTLNLCDRSVEHLKTKHEGQSSYARKAILMHDDLIKQRDFAAVQGSRDHEAIHFLSDLVRQLYLYPKETTERIEKIMQIDDQMREWFREDELQGRGVMWFFHRCRAVLAGVRL